ncbi:MAG: glycosyltransferase [Novosphingobium sp.]|nr:glycosyltransferase [Novosphingobium sp.]
MSVAQIAKGLKSLGHEVAVLNVDDHEHWGTHDGTGVPEYRLKLRNLYTQGPQPAPKRVAWHLVDRLGSAMAADYRRVLRDFRPDIVNTHVMAGIGVGFWQAAAAEGVPIVHRVSDYYLLCLNSGHRKGDENCQGVCPGCRVLALSQARGPARLVNHVVYVSDKIRSIYDEAGVFPADTPGSIIHGAYQPARPVAPRSDLIEPGCLTIGFFGRIAPEKGLAEMLETLAKLPAGGWKLRVGGDGDPAYVAHLKHLAEGLLVTFLGRQSPDDFYATVDTLIVSSLWDEPSGRVAFESGIHGLVPIVAARGGLPEMVDYGARGLVFDPDDPDTLRAAIAKVMTDAPFREQVRARWARDAHDYLPDVVAQRTLAIYRSVLAERPVDALVG